VRVLVKCGETFALMFLLQYLYVFGGYVARAVLEDERYYNSFRDSYYAVHMYFLAATLLLAASTIFLHRPKMMVRAVEWMERRPRPH